MGNLIKTGIIFLAIALLAVVGYLTYTGQYGLRENAGNLAIRLQELNPFRTNETGENKVWQTHTTDYYEIKYPPVVDLREEENKVVSFYLDNEDKKYLLSITTGSLGDKSFEEFVNDQAEAHNMLPNIERVEIVGEVKISGYDTRGFNTTGIDNTDSRTFLFLPHSETDYILLIDHTLASDNEDARNLTRQLLATLDVKN
jgi:hypothetical protein